jgi:phosphoribosyl 1,2-cyclic phosphate phosphodiesterase
LIIKFLGTGTSQGIPVVGCKCDACTSTDPQDKRLRTSIFVELEGIRLLIDTGPDLRQQLLANDIDDVDAILTTHEHNDHTAGLDDVRPINFRHQKTLPLYSIPRVLRNIETRFPYIFEAEPYPGAPRIQLRAIVPFESFEVGKVSILPIEYDHGTLKIIGFRIKDMAYLTDVSHLDENAMKHLHGLKVLIISALQRERHNAHLSLEQAIAVATSIGAGHTYFIHMSHTLGPASLWTRDLPLGIQASFDGLILNID